MPHRVGEQRLVAPPRKADQTALFLGHASAQRESERGRHVGEGEDEGAGEREYHCQRHRTKHLPLDPRQRQNRQIDGRDDQFAEHRRAPHFHRGVIDSILQFLPVSRRPSARWRSATRRTEFSVIITAPSTISPKSIAPRLIRLPEMSKRRMRLAAISIESGMTVAVSNAPRQLPSSRMRTKITISAPSIRFLATVWIVRLTSSVRS